MEYFTIGKLAKILGLTVKTLHHYDAIGLLPSTMRSDAGYRLYNLKHLQRLKNILLLKSLGLPLNSIKILLTTNKEIKGVIEQQILKAEKELIEKQMELTRLLRLKNLHQHQTTDLSSILNDMKEIIMLEKYYNHDNLEQLKLREAELGQDKIHQVQNRWPELIAEVSKLITAGVKPSAPRVKELAKEWNELIGLFTGGSESIAKSCSNMYQAEPEMQKKIGIDSELLEFIAKASHH